MREATGDLWDYPANFRVITANGSVRRDGCAVMGRGCAKQAAALHPTFPLFLGGLLLGSGNHVYYLGEGIYSFPVKDVWYNAARIPMIVNSVKELRQKIDPTMTYVMPRPGCGNGGLSWDLVRPLLVDLPDNVTVITF